MRIVILMILYTFLSCSGQSSKNQDVGRQLLDSSNVAALVTESDSIDIPLFAQKIITSYPLFDIHYEDNKLVFADGTKIVYDDGRNKEFKQMLDESDIEDMSSMQYGVEDSIPRYLNDCGRSRNEEFFKKMYGNSESDVRKNLVTINWFGQKLLFSKVNNAAEQLEKVATELANYKQYKKYLTNASSFYWRKVRGANRQSAHSYGIAIDINTSFSNYWLWSNPRSSETDKIKYENKIPIEIVRIFEKYGFIWGGRWYHYDTMHFEYRPELLSF